MSTQIKSIPLSYSAFREATARERCQIGNFIPVMKNPHATHYHPSTGVTEPQPTHQTPRTDLAGTNSAALTPSHPTIT